eukprot:SM000272S10264  [mRNA]  locus=s272:62131:65186:+ [translate_table: standard]
MVATMKKSVGDPLWMRLTKKFGTVSLIICLLFAIKYLLLSIHFNIHEMKHTMRRECESRLAEVVSTAPMQAEWKQHQFVGRGPYGFVQFSAYRIDKQRFATIGFGATVLKQHRRVSDCTWRGASGKEILGKVELLYPGEEERMPYEVIIIQCTLESATGQKGGELVATLDHEAVLLYREDGGVKTAHQLEPEAPYRHKLTFCSVPISDVTGGPVDGQRLAEWMEFHRGLGVEKSIAYDAGALDNTQLAKLKPFLKTGLLHITSLQGIEKFGLYRSGQVLALNDCIYRSAFDSQWVLWGEWDDYLWVDPHSPLPNILKAHESEPWLSHGARWWSTNKCTPPKAKDSWPVERMVFTWPHYFCVEEGSDKVDPELCPGKRGDRKLFINPRKVRAAKSNEVVDPAEGGLHIRTTALRHDHYAGLHNLKSARNFCSEVHTNEEIIEWWARDYDTAERAKETRTHTTILVSHPK